MSEFYDLQNEIELKRFQNEKKQKAIQNLQFIDEYFKSHTEEQNKAILEFLKQDPAFESLYNEWKESHSEEVGLIGWIFGKAIGDSSTDTFASRYAAGLNMLQRRYSVDPNKFNQVIGSRHMLTYTAIKMALPEIKKTIDVFRRIGYFGSISSPEYLYRITQNIPDTTSKYYQQTQQQRKVKNTATAISLIGSVLITGGLAACTGGISFIYGIDDLICAPYSWLVHWISSKMWNKIQKSQDEIAAMTPAKAGYTPTITNNLRTEILNNFADLKRAYDASGLQDFYNRHNPEDDDDPDPVEVYKYQQLAAKASALYRRFMDVCECLKGCAMTIAAIYDITRT